ncbi:MAG: AAA family ATPase [bacterium]|nr:AAA family ATPase [bacterium]
MIPIELRLRNFLSYGDDVDPLDFTTFRMACLTGKNGHGKSALLDAVTWAVWGEARKASYSRTPDADLIRLNAEDMSVEFTFILNDREYQVQREFARKQRSSRLEFRGRERGESAFRVLTGANKRETQQRIIETIGLDYKTFVNSSFLQQGRADAFTRQSPRDRKEILGTILGLGYYDRLLEETKLRLSESKSSSRSYEETLQALDEELKEEDEARARLDELNKTIAELGERLSGLRKQEQERRERITSLEFQRKRMDQIAQEEAAALRRKDGLAQRLNDLKTERESLAALLSRENEIASAKQRHDDIGVELRRLLDVDAEAQSLQTECQRLQGSIDAERARLREDAASKSSTLQQIESALKEGESLLARRDSIEAEYKRFQADREMERELEAVHRDVQSLEQQKRELETKIENEKQTLLNQAAELRGRCQDLPALRDEVERLKRDSASQPELTREVEALCEKAKSIEEQGVSLNTALDSAANEMKRLKDALNEAHEKTALARRGEATYCPLCRQPLAPDARHELEQHLRAEIQSCEERIARLTEQIKEDERRRDELRGVYKQAREETAGAEQRLAQVASRVEALPAREKELAAREELLQRGEALARQVETGAFAQTLRESLKDTESRIAALQYDPASHSELRERLRESGECVAAWNRLREELPLRERRAAEAKRLRTELAALNATLASDAFAEDARKALDKAREALAPLTAALAFRKPLQDEQYNLRNAVDDWNRLGYARERLPAIEKDERSARDESTELNARFTAWVEEKKAIEPALKTLLNEESALAHIRQVISERDVEYAEVQRALGAAQERLDRLSRRREERKALREKLADSQRDRKLYEILRGAFSRDGIPAMIVDQSLPELENDANRLLHRLTNGICSVALESQREKKSGGSTETLDIRISDDAGTRDYEMYSGGEAFRTDLALRIALSQLLCRRAGSRLQLLVIDEGFGTQDAEGLLNIIEAIGDIQDEFEKIIVVTHLEELKERFMVRIDVNKEPGAGSRFQVVHT